jgi:hypothetical protein
MCNHRVVMNTKRVQRKSAKEMDNLTLILQRQKNCAYDSEISFRGQRLSNNDRSDQSSTKTKYKPPHVTKKY